jgi:hypothetical protein
MGKKSEEFEEKLSLAFFVLSWGQSNIVHKHVSLP